MINLGILFGAILGVLFLILKDKIRDRRRLREYAKTLPLEGVENPRVDPGVYGPLQLTDAYDERYVERMVERVQGGGIINLSGDRACYCKPGWRIPHVVHKHRHNGYVKSVATCTNCGSQEWQGEPVDAV